MKQYKVAMWVEHYGTVGKEKHGYEKTDIVEVVVKAENKNNAILKAIRFADSAHNVELALYAFDNKEMHIVQHASVNGIISVGLYNE